MTTKISRTYVWIFALLLVTCATGLLAQRETPGEHDARMQWWREARFGMFIHWGLYSIPAGEWKGRTDHAEWIRTTAQIPLAEYEGFVSQFNPVKFNADEWVRTAKAAGVKYIVITSKHHDGFCLFDSKYTDFDVASTPFHRDILKELADACHRQDIKICFYHSIMDWHHPDYLPRRDWEKDRTTEGADFNRYVTYMKNELRELLTNYGDIGVLWFDGEWENTWNQDYGRDLYAYVRSLQPKIIVNNRVGAARNGMQGLTKEGEFGGDFGTPEQEVPATGIPRRRLGIVHHDERSLGLQQKRSQLQIHEGPRPDARRYRIQGRQSAPQCRADLRGSFPFREHRPAQGNRQLDEGQRGGNLRHAGQPV